MSQTPLFHMSRGTDSYKFTHHKQYPPGTTHVFSYFAARGAPAGWSGDVLFFGLQYFLKRYLAGTVVTREQILRSAEMVAAHFGNPELFNTAGWMHILEHHNGRLPVVINALPEGSIAKVGQPLFTIENTDPACHWLTSYLETLLVQTWSMCTVATNSWECKRVLRDALELSGDPAGLPFKLHDFGYRGVTCPEAAATAGAAHLVSFMGTDTFAAIDMLAEYYGCNQMPGYSIPASEHSTITSWGKEHELGAYANMLDQYPTGLFACVSDSYDVFSACKNLWGGVLRDRVLARNGTLVVRPDSGELPGTVLAVLDALGESFGTTVNAKGYRVLPSQVRVIQGDGIDRSMLRTIVDEMLRQRWSIDNIAFGSGGGLLQKFDRDTLRFAMKCSSIRVNGEERDCYKAPVTDPGKTSLRGRLEQYTGEMVEVFRDGTVLIDQHFEDIRTRAAIQTP
jgi:nicotinamide phosphoribosyltransferase